MPHGGSRAALQMGDTANIGGCNHLGFYLGQVAYELRDRKLGNLSEMKPQEIASANIGCITHLQSGTATPVRHWVEVLDDALA